MSKKQAEQSPGKKDQSTPQISNKAAMIGVVVFIVVAIIYACIAFAQVSAPCDTFRNYQAKDVPARCLNEYSQPRTPAAPREGL